GTWIALASVVIIFRLGRLRLRTDQPRFDEITSAAIFDICDKLGRQGRRKISRCLDEFWSLEEKNIAFLETASRDQAPLDLNRQFPKWVGILQPEHMMIFPFDIQIMQKTRGMIQSKRAATAVGEIEMKTERE